MSFLEEARRLVDEYPWLDVHAACVDFTAPLELPYRPDGVRTVAFFPGSSLGNFEPRDAERFLRNLQEADEAYFDDDALICDPEKVDCRDEQTADDSSVGGTDKPIDDPTLPPVLPGSQSTTPGTDGRTGTTTHPAEAASPTRRTWAGS